MLTILASLGRTTVKPLSGKAYPRSTGVPLSTMAAFEVAELCAKNVMPAIWYIAGMAPS